MTDHETAILLLLGGEIQCHWWTKVFIVSPGLGVYFPQLNPSAKPTVDGPFWSTLGPPLVVQPELLLEGPCFTFENILMICLVEVYILDFFV